MTAFNVVRFKVKPGNEQQFIDCDAATAPAEARSMASCDAMLRPSGSFGM